MKPIHLILFCSLAFSATRCDIEKNTDLKLRIYNLSEKAIYVDYSTDFPDTSLIHMTNPAFNPQTLRVEAKSIQAEFYGAPSKGMFNEKMDTLSIFIFDAEKIETTPWDTVKSKCVILKRYDLSLEDLEKKNWIITYP